jgi:hypothetical protein
MICNAHHDMRARMRARVTLTRTPAHAPTMRAPRLRGCVSHRRPHLESQRWLTRFSAVFIHTNASQCISQQTLDVQRTMGHFCIEITPNLDERSSIFKSSSYFYHGGVKTCAQFKRLQGDLYLKALLEADHHILLAPNAHIPPSLY